MSAEARIERLRSVALTTAIHADALQTHVAVVQALLEQIGAEEQAAEALSHHIAAKRRELAKVEEVDLKRQRLLLRQPRSGSTTTVGVDASSRASSSPRASRSSSNVADALSFARAAIVDGDLPSAGAVRRANSSGSGVDGGVTSNPVSSTAARLAEEIEQTRAKLMKHEAQSVMGRLHRLQQAKAAAAAAIKALDPSLRGLKNGGARSEAPLQLPHSLRGIQAEAGSIVDAIQGAVDRLSTRVVDALGLISDVASASDDPLQIHAASCYRSLATDPDVRFALELSEVRDDDLAEHFEAIQLAQRCSSGKAGDAACVKAKDRPTDPTPAPPLSPWYYAFAPAEAVRLLPEAAQCLARPDMAGPGCDSSMSLLPPAKHVFTPRYSFESLSELRKLQKLRWELHKTLIDLYCTLDDPADEGLLLYESGRVGDAEAGAVATARRLLGNAASWRGWPVIALDVRQGAEDDDSVVAEDGAPVIVV